MDLTERIDRRKRSDAQSRLVREYQPLSPVWHPPEPSGRGLVLEQVLDALDPVFDGQLPPALHLYGPKGTGKSAVFTALFRQLQTLRERSRSVIPTTTRADYDRTPAFVYVDARLADSEFAVYHAVVDSLADEPVPRQGISTDTLRERLDSRLTGEESVVVGVDHTDEPETFATEKVKHLFGDLSGSISWVTVSHESPADLGVAPTESVEFRPYERHELVELLTSRTSEALGRHAVTHDQIRTVVEWADGDAHDALAAVFGAVECAREADRERVSDEDITEGMDAVPWQSASLGRVFALPANRQRVLAELVALDDDARHSVTEATAAIAAADGVDLSPTTVKRFLYELTEVGITQRVINEDDDGIGRPSSRIEARFPTRVFRRLYELDL